MTPTTTPTINGLRLVSPEEAGYFNTDSDGNKISVIIECDGKPINYITERDRSAVYTSRLIPLTKPRTTRPYTRKEVKCGDVFRRRACGCNYMVTRIRDDDVFLGGDYGVTSFEALYGNFDRLTYDSEGREVLEVAGVEE